MNLEVFQSGWWKQSLSLALCEHWVVVLLLIFPGGSVPALGSLFTCMWAQYSAGISQRALYMSLEFFLCVDLSPPIPGLQTLASWSFLDSQLHGPNLRCPLDSAWVLLPWPAAGNLSQDSKLGKPQVHLICFPGCRAHCPSLPDIQYLAKYCFMYIVHFRFLQVDVTSCYSVLARSRSPWGITF